MLFKGTQGGSLKDLPKYQNVFYKLFLKLLNVTRNKLIVGGWQGWSPPPPHLELVFFGGRMTSRGQWPRGGACECLHPPPPLQVILYPRLDRDPPPPKKKKLYPISPTAFDHDTVLPFLANYKISVKSTRQSGYFRSGLTPGQQPVWSECHIQDGGHISNYPDFNVLNLKYHCTSKSCRGATAHLIKVCVCGGGTT